jgi:hypothetical protein
LDKPKIENVTEDILRNYIQTFHDTIESTSLQFLTEEQAKSLKHLSLLPAKIVGYVSTHFGAGIEYVPNIASEINIKRGSQRIEYLFVQSPPYTQNLTPMFNFQNGTPNTLNCSGISSLTLEGTFPIKISSEDASICFSDVRFKIGNWQRDVVYAEICGNRTADFWSSSNAISRAKDEVLKVLVQAKRAQALNLNLSEYLPQKIRTIGNLARFVLVDDSAMSGHLMEIEFCKQNNWVTVLLRNNGIGASWMTANASAHSKVIYELPYDLDDCDSAISMAIKWSEEKIAELTRGNNSTYPWR